VFFEQIHPNWQRLLEQDQARLNEIELSLKGQCFVPPATQVMRAFEADPRQIKVVIVGQDPYPTPGHAIGLAFAVPANQPAKSLPPTLRNILKELFDDLNRPEQSVALQDWADQGVFLVNRHLTTNPGVSLAHEQLGWQAFTNQALKVLAASTNPRPIFLLWGRQAQQVAAFLPAESTVVQSVHPSPLSAYRGFFGSKPFSKINQLLENQGQAPINWAHDA